MCTKTEERMIRRLMVQQALTYLSKEQLLVLLLRNVYGFSIAEICRTRKVHYRWVQRHFLAGMLQVGLYWGQQP